ncbi:MAG: cell division protein ZapB [Magnetococcus sp. MYC-9]
MNLSGQQHLSAIQQESAVFSTVPSVAGVRNDDDLFALGEATENSHTLTNMLPGNRLAQMLESRINGLIQTITRLHATNSELRQRISDHDEYIDMLEQENAMLAQQLEQFTAAQGQVIDGLAQILNRFPGGAWMADQGDEMDEEEGLLESRVAA